LSVVSCQLSVVRCPLSGPWLSMVVGMDAHWCLLSSVVSCEEALIPRFA
jgi:hypothetical protein